MRVRDLFTIAGFFLATGVAIVAVPYFALATLGLAVVLALYVRNALWTSAIAVLVLVPMHAIFSSSPAESYSTAVISQAIEAGDPLRQVAIILLLLIGLAFLVHRPRELPRDNLLIWLAIYVGMATASLLWSQDRLLTLRGSIVAISVIVFSLGIGCVYYGRQPRGHVYLVRAICWTSTAVSMLILALAVFQGNFHVSDVAWRLGSMGHENQISQVAAVGLLGAILTRKRRDIWPGRIQVLCVMLFPGLAVVLTKSRTTWLALVASILVVEVCKRRSTAKKLAMILVMGSVLGLLVFASSSQRIWMRGASEGETATLSGRTKLWEQLWTDATKHVWLGYGFHAFWSPETVSAQAGEWTPTSAHNGYLDMVAELGLVGLAMILILIWLSSRNAWRLMKFPGYVEIGLYLLALNSMVLVVNGAESFIEDIEYFPMIVILVLTVFVAHRLTRLKPRCHRSFCSPGLKMAVPGKRYLDRRTWIVLPTTGATR